MMPAVVPLSLPRPPALVLRGQRFDSGRPAVMAVVNRTHDSFWAGNRHGDLDDALAALDAAVAQCADIVDVGGVRAGQEGEDVSAALEKDRVLPFLRGGAGGPPRAGALAGHLAQRGRGRRGRAGRPRQRHLGGPRPGAGARRSPG
ncbi:Non functional Dihydropteroate synthase 2 [Serinicoccus hydrothermalis]|uniref:Non functional Dihydropteroate synthase 2 n=1 Tax=Serinicoccus hydrothermalis TaxID=1758689 RepID=A0A1B1NFM7_9MICO|nr:Non functional Dihydropteroate synthase 2 [Serinicoccus hydrothermalis]